MNLAAARNILTSAFITMAGPSYSQNAVIIDDHGIANKLANHIAGECHNPRNPTPCIAAGVDAAFTISKQVARYFDLLATRPDELAKTTTTALRLGVLRTQLNEECQFPLQSIGRTVYPNTRTYLEVSKEAVGYCFNFIENTVTAETGENLLPTARNTVAEHLNRLTP
jgi:hypothetical protein